MRAASPKAIDRSKSLSNRNTNVYGPEAREPGRDVIFTSNFTCQSKRSFEAKVKSYVKLQAIRQSCSGATRCPRSLIRAERALSLQWHAPLRSLQAASKLLQGRKTGSHRSEPLQTSPNSAIARCTALNSDHVGLQLGRVEAVYTKRHTSTTEHLNYLDTYHTNTKYFALYHVKIHNQLTAA